MPTDFSANATHAAEYGYYLAKQMMADIILCNAITIPAEVPQAGVIVWPMEEIDMLQKDSDEELKKLYDHLIKHKKAEGFHPAVTMVNECGTLPDVVNNIINTQYADLVVMANHHSDGLSTLLLGNHTSKMINCATQPLLLVPGEVKFTPIKTIAFAIDLENAESDLEEVYKLIPLAKRLNAGILITHIHDEKYQTAALKKHMGDLLTELSSNANYAKISYRVVTSGNIEKGLTWLCEHAQIDMLAMHHRQHGFFDWITNSSHTQKMAGHLSIPLLVFTD